MGSASPWLYGVTGALQGIQFGMQYNQQQKQADIQKQFATLTQLYNEGDDQVKALAAQGLAEIAQKGEKYKGTHLQQIRELMMPMVTGSPNPTMAGIGQPAPQMPPPGSAAPQPAGLSMGGPADLGASPPGAPPGAPPSAALPSTSITAKTGSTAGQPPGAPSLAAAARPAGPVFSAGSPEELGAGAQAAMGAAGISKPEPPDEAAIAAHTAKGYGFTPEEIQGAGFTTPGHLRNKEREGIRANYQRDLTTATTTASSEYRAALADYTRGVMGYVTQVGAAERAVKAEKGRDARLATSEAGKTTRAGMPRSTSAETPDVKEARLQERQARQAWSTEVAKAEADARKLKNPSSPMARLQLKKDPGMPDRMIAEARAAADARYRQLTGKEPPGTAVAAGGESGASPVPGAPPTAKPSVGPLAKAAPAAYSPPPQAPISPSDQRRASQIRAKAQRSGINSITTEERSFMADYQKRGGQ